MSGVNETIREVIEAHGRLPVEVSTLSDTDDLFDQGLTSHARVNVMLALEDAFNFEFPDELLVKSTFESIAAMRGVLIALGVAPSD
jgi:acyl carrier protein